MCARDNGVEVREYNGNITADEDIRFTGGKEGKEVARQENSYV